MGILIALCLFDKFATAMLDYAGTRWAVVGEHYSPNIGHYLITSRGPMKGVPRLPKLLGCSLIPLSRDSIYIIFSFIPGVIFETVLLVVTLYKAYKLNVQSSPQPLLYTIVRDR